jgi:hypothetical protein
MRRALLAIACVSLALAGPAEAKGRRRGAHARADHPVVVELFTSQALAAGVPAEKLVDKLADDPDVLALTFAVDYWDYTGWNDTFAKPEFGARQKAYVQRMALRDLPTPQIFVDGKSQVAGAETKGVEALIQTAKHEKAQGPKLRMAHRSRLVIGYGKRPAGGADVWLVRYDPKVREVVVKRGENRGQTIRERNVVRQLVRLGAWSGKEKTYQVPADGPDAAGLKTAVLLQAAKGGRILGVLQR